MHADERNLYEIVAAEYELIHLNHVGRQYDFFEYVTYINDTGHIHIENKKPHKSTECVSFGMQNN